MGFLHSLEGPISGLFGFCNKRLALSRRGDAFGHPLCGRSVEMHQDHFDPEGQINPIHCFSRSLSLVSPNLGSVNGLGPTDLILAQRTKRRRAEMYQ